MIIVNGNKVSKEVKNVTSRENLVFRVLASLYPDSRPSQIRKIIEKAKQTNVSDDDIELWAALTSEEKIDDTKIIREEHHYHHYDYSGNLWRVSPFTCETEITITNCNDPTYVTASEVYGLCENE